MKVKLSRRLENSSAAGILQCRSEVRSNSKAHDLDADKNGNVTSWPKNGYWIVARELVLYRVVDLTHVPELLRSKVIEKRILQLSPFQHTAHHLCIIGDHAMLWMWDKLLQNQSVDAYFQQQEHSGNSQDGSDLTVLPESVLYIPHQNGFVKQPCVVGDELQHWVAGVLVNAQWVPETGDCLRFIRDCGVDHTIAVEWQEAGSDWLERPWTIDKNRGIHTLLEETFLLRAGLFVLLFACAMQLGELVGWKYESAQIESAIENKREQLMPILSVREKAIQQQESNSQLISWYDSASQLEILAEFDRLLKFDSMQIVEWQYQQDNLVVTVRDDNIDNRAYVESLSSSPLFSNVRVEPGLQPDTIKVSLKITAER